MTADYPDWQRAFRIVGTEITIPINITASAVTLPVSIQSAATFLNVKIIANLVTSNVSIVSSYVTLNVNIAAADVTININFSDQSVAVFDAAKWFAHQAQQICVGGSDSVANNDGEVMVTRAVPAGKVFFVCGLAYSIAATTATPRSTEANLRCNVVLIATLGGGVGGGLIFDTPLRFTAGQVVDLKCWQYGSDATLTMYGTIWGYDEAA